MIYPPINNLYEYGNWKKNYFHSLEHLCLRRNFIVYLGIDGIEILHVNSKNKTYDVNLMWSVPDMSIDTFPIYTPHTSDDSSE